jgi:hypothetical protein
MAHQYNSMKNSLVLLVPYFLTIGIFLSVSSSTSLFAQIGERGTINVQEKPKFTDNLWYGGNVLLNFSSFGTFARESSFNFGLSGMVGYKFNHWLSVGPRISADYVYYSFTLPGLGRNNQSIVAESFSGFARAKVFQNFFGQAEYGISALPLITSGFNLTKEYVERAFLGAGYNSGGKLATEIVFLYDFALDGRFLYPAWDIRFGFTYNF